MAIMARSLGAPSLDDAADLPIYASVSSQNTKTPARQGRRALIIP